MVSRRRRTTVLALSILLVVMLVPVGVASAAATYPADAYDPGDDSPVGALDITPMLAVTGAGAEPWTTSRTLSDAAQATPTSDNDWFRFDVSAQEVIWNYPYLFEAIPFEDALTDPVVEIYGPHAAPPTFSYGWGFTYPPQNYDFSNAIAGDLWGPWFSHPWQSQSTHRGASLEFRPTVAGTYWVRVRPYGDNVSNYYDQAGAYTFRAKIGTMTRVSGTNRIDTAVEISRERYPDNILDGTAGWDNQSAAVVVNGYNFPDALSAAALAGIVNGPLILTAPDYLPSSAGDELRRLNPDTVYVIGGPNAVSNQVITEIRDRFPLADPVVVERVWGTDRIATSIAVAHKALGLAATAPPTPPGFAFIANANNFPDALSASSMSAGNLVPIYLTNGTTLDGRVASSLVSRGITDVIIVGGPGVISPAIESYLKNTLGGGGLGSTHVMRLGGSSRYETSKIFAAWSAGYPSGNAFVGTPGNPNALDVADSRRIGLVTGENFPDALAAGPFCGGDWYRRPHPILLTGGTSLSPWVADIYSQLGAGETSYLEDVYSIGGPTVIWRSYLFGGPGVMSPTVWWGLESQS